MLYGECGRKEYSSAHETRFCVKIGRENNPPCFAKKPLKPVYPNDDDGDEGLFSGPK